MLPTTLLIMIKSASIQHRSVVIPSALLTNGFGNQFWLIFLLNIQSLAIAQRMNYWQPCDKMYVLLMWLAFIVKIKSLIYI